ncbi:hypothetical protein PENSPDRAFT_688412 [Peniophora sp. CONT]|nr:hypothetical protein PENSPDRAFT_688412 [Peniophora sp. CONT]
MSNWQESLLPVVLASSMHLQPPVGNAHSSERPPSELSSPRRGEHCYLCRAEGGRLMRCKRCSTSTYCSVACQRSHWGEHKLLCKNMLAMRVAPTNRITATLRLANRVQRCMVEAWLEMLAITLLGLIEHPERAQTHAFLLRWDIVPVISPREYRENSAPRERLNAAGEQRYMLSLRNFAVQSFDRLGEPTDLPGCNDWSFVRERRAHEPETIIQLDEGEPDPMRVVMLNMVDPGPEDVTDTEVLWRRMLIRNEMLDLTRDIEAQELPANGLPGENMKDYCVRVINELIIKDVGNKWKLRTHLPLQEEA